MASMRDVAKEAGVSVTTVSRVLAQDQAFSVTDRTRERVFRAAEQLDYSYPGRRPQPKIMLGCVLALTTERYSDPFFNSILTAAEDACVKHNAFIQATRNYNDMLDEDVFEEFLELDLSGLILMEELPQQILQMLHASIPHIVLIDQENPSYNVVGFDRFDSSQQIMRALLDRGYSRIAYIGGGSPNSSIHDSILLIVYREALRRCGIDFDESLVRDCEWNLDLCADMTRELMNGPNPPDAIIAGSDSLASVILGVIYNMGLRCPRDIGVVGFNNLNFSAHLIPPLTTVDVPTRQIGITAVERLIDMINGEAGPERRIVFPSRLIMRDSLRKVNS